MADDEAQRLMQRLMSLVNSTDPAMNPNQHEREAAVVAMRTLLRNHEDRLRAVFDATDGGVFGTQLDSLRASLKGADEDMEDAVECADRATRTLRRWKTGGALEAVQMAAQWGRQARRRVHEALTIAGAPPRRRAP